MAESTKWSFVAKHYLASDFRRQPPLARSSLSRQQPVLCRTYDPQCACILGDDEMAKKASASNDIKLVPLGDRVVVKRAEAESKTAGGIVLPDAAKDKPQRGEVLAVGEGHTKSSGLKAALTVKAGDQVIFSSYAGDELKVGDETYLLMRESDILAIIG